MPPSPLTLRGLLQYMAEVERNWFRRVLLGEQVAPIFDATADPNGPDGGFELTEDVIFEQAPSMWEEKIELDQTSPFVGGEVTLRWIYNHMIAEYARHAGHADLLRELVDGTTGV